MRDADDDLRIVAAARTDVGAVRSRNEDSALLLPEDGLFAVADGMGGHAAGEVASGLAVETLAERLGSADADGAVAGERATSAGDARLPSEGRGAGADPGEAAREVREAVEAANRRIHEQGAARPDQRGMGTTATVLLLRGPGRWLVGHVGDSRAYLLRDGELSRVTTDHTVVPGSSTLTRALGTRPDVRVDVLRGELREGDVFLLCSDGLTDVLPEGEIRDGLADAERDAGRAAGALVRAVLDRGARDNVTAVIVAAES